MQNTLTVQFNKASSFSSVAYLSYEAVFSQQNKPLRQALSRAIELLEEIRLNHTQPHRQRSKLCRRTSVICEEIEKLKNL